MNYIYVGIGGFVGAILRYLITISLTCGSLEIPLFTLIINLSGSFLLAYITFYIFEKYKLAKPIKLALTTGLLGSFTTFSTFSIELVTLLTSDKFFLASFYATLSLLGGIAMAYLGYACHRKVVGL